MNNKINVLNEIIIFLINLFQKDENSIMLGQIGWSPCDNRNFSYYLSFRIENYYEDEGYEYIRNYGIKNLCNEVIQSVSKIENREANLDEEQVPSNFQVRNLYRV